MSRTTTILAEFARSDSRAMVAAALHILGAMADDPVQRNDVVAPWAWDLRRRARHLEAAGHLAAAAQAKVVARMVSAVALGEISSTELSQAAATVDVASEELRFALAALESAMRADTRPDVEVVA